MKRFLMLLFLSIPLLVHAQFQSGITIGVLPTSTECRLLFPIGVAIQPFSTVGLRAEYFIPMAKQVDGIINGEAQKYGGQMMFFLENKDEKEIKFRTYIGFEYTYRNETYSKTDDFYYTSNTTYKDYYYSADIKSVVKRGAFIFGGQRVFNNRIVLEWTIGVGRNKKIVDYTNVDRVPVLPPSSSGQTGSYGDPFGIGGSLGQILSGFGSGSSSNSKNNENDINLFSLPFTDDYEKTDKNVSISGNIKIGYMFIHR